MTRLRHILPIAMLGMACAVGARAQDTRGGPAMVSTVVMDETETAEAAPSTLAFMAAARAMQDGMAAPYTGDADLDFVRAMIAHHEGAIAMARVVIDYGADPQVRKLAEGMMATQQSEVDWMTAWLAGHGAK